MSVGIGPSEGWASFPNPRFQLSGWEVSDGLPPVIFIQCDLRLDPRVPMRTSVSLAGSSESAVAVAVGGPVG